MSRRCRVLFANAGLLGHRSVAFLLSRAIACVPDIEARHIDAGTPGSMGERLLRALFCARLAPRTGPVANVDLQRWRSEIHTGLAAARRMRAATADGWVPDVLHFHTQAAAYCSLPAMRRLPSIVSIDCTQTLARQEVQAGLARRSYEPNVRHDAAVFAAARAIVATSEWAAADLRKNYKQAAGRVTVLPYPVQVDPASTTWIEQRAETHGRAVRFLFVGGDFPRKGGWDLLEAWRESDLAASACLDIVTNWPVPAERVPRGVRMHAGVEPYSGSWRDRWREADVFVMPTHAEAFGMVYQEAAAAGVPAIGTRVGAIAEIVEHGITGVLVAPGDIKGIAHAMRLLASEPGLRRRLGTAAWERAGRDWNLERYGRALAEVVLACRGRETALA